MITLSKSIVAFGLLGAIAVGTATPSDARTYHGKFTNFRSVDRSAYAYYRARYVWIRPVYARWGHARWGYGMYPRNYPNPYVRPFVTWNPYGARWEGND
jgi:hypothetical protein